MFIYAIYQYISIEVISGGTNVGSQCPRHLHRREAAPLKGAPSTTDPRKSATTEFHGQDFFVDSF